MAAFGQRASVGAHVSEWAIFLRYLRCRGRQGQWAPGSALRWKGVEGAAHRAERRSLVGASSPEWARLDAGGGGTGPPFDGPSFERLATPRLGRRTHFGRWGTDVEHL